MTGARPLQVVTVTGRNVSEARREADAARLAGADLVEVRVDRWSPVARRRVGELFPASVPLVATYRSRAEGGSGASDPPRREKVLRELAALPFAYVDLEAERDRSLEGTVGALGPKVVRSTHFPPDVTAPDLRRRVSEPPPSGGLVKVVVPASVGRSLRELLPLLEELPDPRPVLLATGPAGSIWRGWAARSGLPWVYSAPPGRAGSAAVEPSQVPVDRLAPFLAAPEAPLFAVVGHPVTHSRSPDLHHGWMRRAGRTGLYVAADVETPEEFALLLAEAPARGLQGINVTHPWKVAAFRAATEPTEEARRTGTANCLTFRGGAIEADNTDLGAIERRLRELRDAGRWKGDRLAVLGAGGAATSTLAATRAVGAVGTVFARRKEDAERLALAFGSVVGDPGSTEPFDLVVHATVVGRAGGGPLELPSSALLRRGGYLLDWVYDADVPVLREAARSAGAEYEDGRRLLVYQAALSFGRWWDEAPDEAAVDEALREVGCAA